jgi:hypothetical protein
MIVVKYKIYLHSLQNRPEKLAKGLFFYMVSKAGTNKLRFKYLLS